MINKPQKNQQFYVKEIVGAELAVLERNSDKW